MQSSKNIPALQTFNDGAMNFSHAIHSVLSIKSLPLSEIMGSISQEVLENMSKAEMGIYVPDPNECEGTV